VRFHKSIFVVLAIVMAASLALGGCRQKSPPEVSPARKANIELMQKVPVFYEDFEFWDAKTLRENPDLSEMYQVWHDRKVKFLEERYGIDSDGIEYLAHGEGGLLDIFVTEYDIEVLRDRIATDFQRDVSYRDTEVWKSEPSHDPQSLTGGY